MLFSCGTGADHERVCFLRAVDPHSRRPAVDRSALPLAQAQALARSAASGSEAKQPGSVVAGEEAEEDEELLLASAAAPASPAIR